MTVRIQRNPRTGHFEAHVDGTSLTLEGSIPRPKGLTAIVDTILSANEGKGMVQLNLSFYRDVGDSRQTTGAMVSEPARAHVLEDAPWKRVVIEPEEMRQSTRDDSYPMLVFQKTSEAMASCLSEAIVRVRGWTEDRRRLSATVEVRNGQKLVHEFTFLFSAASVEPLFTP